MGTDVRRYDLDGAPREVIWKGRGGARVRVLPDGRETLWRWAGGDGGEVRIATLGPDGPVDVGLPDGRYDLVGVDGSGGLWLRADVVGDVGPALGRVVALGATPAEPSTWVEHHVDGDAARWTSVRLQGGALVAVEERDGAAHVVEVDVATGARREPFGLPLLSASVAGGPGGEVWVHVTRADGSAVTWLRDPSGGYTTLYDGASAGRPLEGRAVQAPSVDGTLIPLTLVHAPGVAPDGARPAWLRVYGGFGHGIRGGVRGLRPWIEAGGVVVTVHARGDDERGEAWHEAATKEHLTRKFEDVEAAADWLVSSEWSQPGRIVVGGSSNGGLSAMGAVARQPEKFGGAWSAAGVHDLVEARRYGRWWPGEYGRPGHPAQGAVLRASSPMHTTPPGPLPPVLVITGAEDPTVSPSHAYKLVAAWSERPGGPVHLERWPHSSHTHHYGPRRRRVAFEAMGRDTLLAEQARIVAFLAMAVGVEVPALEASAPGGP